MTGADIIVALLRDDATLTAVVAVDRIKLGLLPENVTLPAILIRTVSSTDWQPLKRSPSRRTTDRVSATVRAGNYRDQVVIIRLIRTICVGRTGDLAGAQRVSVLSAGTGPDLIGPGNSFEQAQDLRVSFDTEA